MPHGVLTQAVAGLDTTKTYTVSYWFKWLSVVPDNYCFPYMRLGSATAYDLTGDTALVPATNQWLHVSGTVQALDDVAPLKVFLACGGERFGSDDPPRIMLLDDVSIVSS